MIKVTAKKLNLIYKILKLLKFKFFLILPFQVGSKILRFLRHRIFSSSNNNDLNLSNFKFSYFLACGFFRLLLKELVP